MAKHFVVGGKSTKRMQILYTLYCTKGMRKSEIVEKVYGKDMLKHLLEVGNLRGWNSKTFTEMVKDGRLHYDYHNRIWTLGSEGLRAILEDSITNKRSLV